MTITEPAALPQLVSDLLGELAADCEAKSRAPCRTAEGRDLAAAYAVVAALLTELRIADRDNSQPPPRQRVAAASENP